MKRRILALAGVLALGAALVVPMAVFAAETTQVSGTIPAATVTVTAPSAIVLATLPYNATTAQQVVVSSTTNGSVAVSELRGKSFAATVTGSSINLTSGANTLTNALQIATGTDATGKQIGNVTAAAALSSGAWSDPGAVVVAVTASSQQIATGQTATPLVLKLTAFQKIDASEDHPAGTYNLTLTYAGTVTE